MASYRSIVTAHGLLMASLLSIMC